jgi:hypothetical protein
LKMLNAPSDSIDFRWRRTAFTRRPDISASGPTEGGGALTLAAIWHRLAGGYGNQPSAVR